MSKANRGGWQTCNRGHKYRGAGPCPICWPNGAKKKSTAKRSTSRVAGRRATR